MILLILIASVSLVVVGFVFARRMPVASYLIAGGLYALSYYATGLTRAALHSHEWGPMAAMFTFPAAVVSFVLAVLLTIRTFHARPSLFAFAAVVPILLVMSHVQRSEQEQVREAERDRQAQIAEEARWARERRDEDSPIELKRRGLLWGSQNEIEDDAKCRELHRRAEFISGCLEFAAKRRYERGKQWSNDNAKHFEDCTRSDDPLRDNPDFIRGCTDVIHAARRSSGSSWASENFIFDPQACKSAPQGKNDPDFVDGCTNAFDRQFLWNDVVRWVTEQKITRPQDCYGRIKGAPADFESGCDKFIRSKWAEAGEAWARQHQEAESSVCKQSPDGAADTSEFISACEHWFLQVRFNEGTDWAQDNYIFLTADCEREWATAKKSAEFLRGCEQIATTPEASRRAGQHWALQHHAFEESACDAAVPNATSVFIKECKKTVADHLRATLNR